MKYHGYRLKNKIITSLQANKLMLFVVIDIPSNYRRLYYKFFTMIIYENIIYNYSFIITNFLTPIYIVTLFSNNWTKKL